MIGKRWRSITAAGVLLAGCAAPAIPDSQSYGASPTLPVAHVQVIPTVKIAPAVGWPAGQTPRAAPGYAVVAFAAGLDHPRWLYVLPNGDVLVAETNSPGNPPRNIREQMMGAVMAKAGANTPSRNRITLLRDADGDGVAESRATFLEGLTSPFGMALVGDAFYVANTDAIVRFRYAPGAVRITTPGERVAALPAGRINHHWTKNLIASPDGRFLYAAVGSNSNVGENGMAEEEGRAAIWQVDAATGQGRVFASGLRNPVGMDFRPGGNSLWTVVNERDEIGDDLVPDYLTSVKDGAFYGWPYSYYGATVDPRPMPQRPDLVSRAIAPDYALGAHTASLGLMFYRGDALPALKGFAIIGQHGSWNRSKPVGYRVIATPFDGAGPSGPPQEILTGFLSARGEAMGRPVGVAMDRTGAILVADDVGNVIWRVTKSSSQ